MALAWAFGIFKEILGTVRVRIYSGYIRIPGLGVHTSFERLPCKKTWQVLVTEPLKLTKWLIIGAFLRVNTGTSQYCLLITRQGFQTSLECEFPRANYFESPCFRLEIWAGNMGPTAFEGDSWDPSANIQGR